MIRGSREGPFSPWSGEAKRPRGVLAWYPASASTVEQLFD